MALIPNFAPDKVRRIMFGPGDDRPTNTKTSKDKTSEILSPQNPNKKSNLFPINYTTKNISSIGEIATVIKVDTTTSPATAFASAPYFSAKRYEVTAIGIDS